MRNTVRTSIATAAAVALLALTACGSATESAAPAAAGPYAAPAKDITATISVSNWGDPGDKAVYDGVAERFKEKYPNVTVNNNFTPITTWTEYVNKLGDRVRLLHLKDMAQGPEKRFAPVGTGVIDFKPSGSFSKRCGLSRPFTLFQ